MRTQATPEPLGPTALAVLVALSGGPLSGVDVMAAANSTFAAGRLLGPGTLYRVLRDLRRAGLISRVAILTRPADDRVTHHELTALGRRIVKAEVHRLERTLALAHTRRPKPFTS